MTEARSGPETGGGDDVEPPAYARRGPRLGGGVGKARILDVATGQFGELGYQAATMRKIAEAAGVDAKLVHYYFGSKEDLFGAVISAAFRARGFPNLLGDALTDEQGSPGTRYLEAVLRALEDPGMGPAFIGLVRGLGTHEESRRIFLRFVTEELLGWLAPRLNGIAPEQRISLAGSQMLGLIMARYILRVPPLASMSIGDAAALIGPTIDRYLFANLEGLTTA